MGRYWLFDRRERRCYHGLFGFGSVLPNSYTGKCERWQIIGGNGGIHGVHRRNQVRRDQRRANLLGRTAPQSAIPSDHNALGPRLSSIRER